MMPMKVPRKFASAIAVGSCRQVGAGKANKTKIDDNTNEN